MEELKQEKIDGWKKEYGRVFQCKIAGKTYVYRTLKRGEFEDLQRQVVGNAGPQQVLTPETASQLEDGMVDLCVIYPENIKVSSMEAGTPAVLATYISDMSGFRVDEEPVAL